MVNILITGFKSNDEAEEFIHWFEGQGEQDTYYWFEIIESESVRGGIYCNMEKTFPIHKTIMAIILWM